MDAFLDIMGSSAWLWAAALLGVLVSALAAGMETGLYRLNRIRLRLRADSGDRRAKTLQDLLGDLRGQIIVCDVSVNLGDYLTTAMLTSLVASAGWVDSPAGIELVTTPIAAMILFVFGNVVPKSVFVAVADHWMYPLARPLKVAYVVYCRTGVVPALSGLSTLVLRVIRRGKAAAADPFHPRERLRAILREGSAEGVISGYQHELVGKVLGLREQLVHAVMIPIGRVAAVAADIDRERFLAELRRHSFSRLPVWEGRRENVVGIVHIMDVLAAGEGPVDLRALMNRDFASVPPDMTVPQALLKLRKARASIAVVRDDKGRAVGVITIKDLVEEVVGELAEW
jgi:CBS domain containing-hemolysin-like protein